MGFEFPMPDLVLPNLYLGDWDCSRNKHGLKKLGISHVLTVAEFQPPYPDV